MTCRLEDAAYDYRISTDAARAPLEGGFERLRVAGEPDVRRVIEGCARSHVAQSALRGFLKAEVPLEQVHRLSDGAVRERVVALVARRPAAIWRRPRLLGTSSWEGAPERAADEAAASELTLAQATAAPTAPLAPGAVRCGDAWAAVDAETRAVLARGGDADPITRNRHISAAYARLYQREPSLTWGGLAAVVSRQAGCAMQHAKEIDDGFFRDVLAGDANEIAYDALADANKLIFEDIYPPMRFYEQHGITGIERCAGARPGGRRVPTQIRQALRQTSTGTRAGIRQGADLIAQYEQVSIVQDRIYSDPKVAETFESNQWWARRRAGRWAGAQKPEIPLSAGCGGDTIPFRGDINVANDRVAYYRSLMDTFESRSARWKQQTMTRIAGMGR